MAGAIGSLPFPILWSGGSAWTADVVVDDPPDADVAFWHNGLDVSSNTFLQYGNYGYPYEAEVTGAATGCWLFNEEPSGTGSNVYLDLIGDFHFDAVTAVMSKNTTQLFRYNTYLGIDFDTTGEVSATNDGTFDWTSSWVIDLWCLPDDTTPVSAETLFEVAGTDGFKITLETSGKIRLTNTTDATYTETDSTLDDDVTYDGELWGAGEWTTYPFHIVVGWDSVDGVKISFNGYDETTTTDNYSGSASQPNNTKITIGGSFNGPITALVIYNTPVDDGYNTTPHGIYFDSWDHDNTIYFTIPYYADDYTGDMDTTSTGEPTLKVAVNGYLVLEELQHASWRLGRPGWFDELEPANASLQFLGLVDAEPGDDVCIYCERDVLWSGVVDDTVSTRGEDSFWRTTITAIDVFATLAQTELAAYQTARDAANSKSSLKFHIQDVLSDTKANNVAVIEPYDDAVGTLTYYDYAFDGDLLSYLNRQAWIGNAFLVADRHNDIRKVVRGGFSSASAVDVIQLAGVDSPSEWNERISSADIINDIFSENTGGTEYINITDLPSQDIYGEKALTFEAPEAWTAFNGGVWPDSLMNGLADPRPVLDAGVFHITDLDQRALLMEPLDTVRHNDLDWTVLQVGHEVTLDDWVVTVAGEPTVDYLIGATDDTDTEDGALTIDTQTITASKDAVIRLDKDTGAKTGAGAITYLPVGATGPNGFKYRALIEFNITWPAGFVRVHRARLKLQTSDESTFQHGGKPRTVAQRIRQSWTEGTESSLSANNAVVWGDVWPTSDGQTVKRTTSNNDVTVYLDVTDIAQGWYDHGNNGVMLSAANEFRTRNRQEFYSSDHGSGDAPQLILECVVSS